jgi:hypothetical protein
MASGGVGQDTGGVGTGGTTAPSGESGGLVGSGRATPGGQFGPGGADPNFHIFLLIGQSNMEGVPAAEEQDEVENPRVKVLAYDDCENLGHTYDRWYTARPPLHSCKFGLGPGDYFGKALAAALPNATIGLVPNAIAGVDIDFFRKGVVSRRRNEFKIPPDNHWSGAYDWVISRARLAQCVGVIRGILFHQGESDAGQEAWIGKVKGIVEDLRTDLNLGDVPFLAGELLHDGSCERHNDIIVRLPSHITNAHVVSASGLRGFDQCHFDAAAQRTLGQRYADKLLEVWRP